MRYLLAVSIVLATCGTAFPQAKDEKLDYRELVKGLVSPNKPIRIRNYPPTIAIPPNFDWKAQERIEKNRAILYEHCEEALPFLIEGCTDNRFSLVSQWSEDPDYYAWNVGRVCSEIIQRHVEVFRKQMNFSLRRWHKYNFVPIGQAKEAREWWNKRKGMSLRELQLAGFDWAIEKVKHESDGEEGGELKALVAARDKLRKASKPLPDGVMWESLVAPPKDYLGYKVVPWNEKGK
jgi:hypothetical protein